MSDFQHERSQVARKWHLCQHNHLIRPGERYWVCTDLPGSSMDYQSGDVHEWDFSWFKLCTDCYNDQYDFQGHPPAHVQFITPALRKAFVKALADGHQPEPDPRGMGLEMITERYRTIRSDRFTCFRSGCERAFISSGRDDVWGSMISLGPCPGTADRKYGMYAPKVTT